MSRLAIRVNGRWLDSIGPWGTPIVTWRYPYGCWELTWEMSQAGTHGREHHSLTRLGEMMPPGSPVEAFIGLRSVWAGYMPIVEPDADDDQVTFTALGACREAEGVACLTFEHRTTSKARTAARAAKARGVLSWRDVRELPNEPFADPDSNPSEAVDETAALNYLGALLDAWSEEHNQRWGVDGDRDVWTRSDPTRVGYFVEPSTSALGATTEAEAGSLLGRYIAKTDGKLATARVGTDLPEKLLDMTKLGKISGAKATQKLTNLFAKVGNVSGWKNGVTISPEQITQPGGVRPHLGVVGYHCGKGVMVRLMGQDDPRNPGLTYVDAVVGEAVWNQSENTLALTPVNTSGDDFNSMLENAGISVVS